MKGIKIIQPGVLATIQDLGRRGYQQYGMPTAGAMDSFALQAGNLLVGNKREEAGIEITYPGFEGEFLSDCIFAVTGGDLGVKMDGRYVPVWKSIQAERGSRVSFSELRGGIRSYLTVSGGVDVPLVMGSKSTYLRGKIGGMEGRKLKAGDIVCFGAPNSIEEQIIGKRLPLPYIPAYGKTIGIRVILGPQHHAFTAASLAKFLGTSYRIGQNSDRMGYRLEGERLEHTQGADIISDGIALGAVQVPDHGMPIIMLADRQTTGGYTKIATVISVDISHLAQRKPGDEIVFTEVSVDEAQRLMREQEQLLCRLKAFLSVPRSRNYIMAVSEHRYDITIEDWIDFE